MSWLLHLYETYEANEDKIGKVEKKHNGSEYTLLPISHTTQNAHIEVTITESGEFHSATVIDKSDRSTLIPTTEASANRAGAKIAPYPLHDKLSYTAGDYVKYGRQVKNGDPFSSYIQQLEDWAASSYVHPKIQSIYQYVKKGCLIEDLVKEKILFLDAEEKLISKWDTKHEALHGEKPAIFSTVGSGQESAFVRFNVYSTKELLTKVWKDHEVYNSFITFYKDQLSDNDICYVTGQELPSTERHSNKIRHAADKAKLISANDTSGFTFRGRFQKSYQVANISYDVSQKAHNALKWLIHRQGKVIDERVFLVWEKDQEKTIDPHEDSFDLFGSRLAKENLHGFANEEFARQLSKAIDGYKYSFDYNANVNILVLDSATTGRLAVLYYRHLEKEFYLNRMEAWHRSCSWLHTYRKTDGDRVEFLGAPATKDIAFAAYGPRVSDEVVKGTMERLLPCIIDGRKTPRDIVKSSFQRASNPVSMEKWEWEKTLSIACALIKKEEGYPVALDHEEQDRDYLFGRLLAIADVLERRALGNEENRATNAIRYMSAYSKHPARTWKTIQDSLQPYQARLGAKAGYLSSLIDEVGSKLSIEDFTNRSLSERYLLGFYSQRHELYQKKEKKDSAVSTNQEEE
ncbi:CRISPR-associated protein Csd1 [Salibacterium salarium]|uniref:type I-C CRISPR-associated protein Cas8c/Csd1 n=1 Tax=Salibacterium salarium TaxID=284579 RepID=UPI0027832F69|nr:type I-C CRISPR-associated protein Cas8c/Csd1 [Salibacterium salarium]MDQ0300598.1 CRISPR-associated protein Csd1 [Salibacterium salarium]